MTDTLLIDGVDLTEPKPGHSLPPGAFTSAGVFDAEMRHVFTHSWVHVADIAEMKSPGDYVTGRIGRSPVIVMRGVDGELRGFLNACRHRGAMLAQSSGNCSTQLKCAYHAWSYQTDGTLVGVPLRDEFKCQTKGMDLIPVRVGTVGPMVFGCLDDNAPPLQQWVGELSPALERAHASDMTPAYEVTYDVPVNWKVFMENGLEGYHIDYVHDFVAQMFSRSDRRTANHFFQPHASHTHVLIDKKFRALQPPVQHLSDEENARVRIGNVFPNLITVLTPGDLSYLRIDPIGPEMMRLCGRSFDLPGPAVAMRDFRKQAFDRANRQDIDIVTLAQKGLHAHGLPAGVHADGLECRIGHFERTLVRMLAAHCQATTL